jgi:integrase
LDATPRRLDVRLVFPGHRGGVIDLKNFRGSQWKPALDSAGIPSRRIYDMRHSFATWALDAGLSIFDLSRYMGTSVEMIDRTYGHLAQGAEETARARLDAAYARRSSRAVEEDDPTSRGSTVRL